MCIIYDKLSSVFEHILILKHKITCQLTYAVMMQIRQYMLQMKKNKS